MFELPETLDPENSLLFLGSGFSAGAISVTAEQMPAGNPLKAKLATLLGEDPKLYDLQTLATEFAGEDGDRLWRLLYDTFTVSQVSDDQKAILSLPWRRIYTTNYDNIIEQQCPDVPNYDSINRSLGHFSQIGGPFAWEY